MKPLYAITILGPLIGFGIGAGVDRVWFPQIPEYQEPTQEWCDAAFVRKAEFGHVLKSTPSIRGAAQEAFWKGVGYPSSQEASK